jgi:hypothetical protein
LPGLFSYITAKMEYFSTNRPSGLINFQSSHQNGKRNYPRQ